MQFNSLTFLTFFIVVFVLYWRFGRRGQNRLLLFASYLFYAWWDWRFLSLILYSSLLDFFVAQRIDTAPSERSKRRWLITSIVGNLAMLTVFKYFNFFVDSAATLLAHAGLEAHPTTLQIILPIGISFYTFQTMSYTIDVFRGKIRPASNWLSYFTYVSYFPQLVSGPIERGARLLPQFERGRTFRFDEARDGLRQCLWGLFKKVAIADLLAILVDQTYGQALTASGWELLLAAYFFIFQVYCDFSGYSDMAIGMSKLMGIRLMRNFNYPFFASSLRAFWQRWHISLATWFRDYLYIPLCGNRRTGWQVKRNLLVTFAIVGLWHGANWTFVVFGAIHGVGLIVESAVQGVWTRLTKRLGRAGEFIGIFIVFHVFVLSGVFFRARSVQEAWGILSRMVTPGHLPEWGLIGWAGAALIAGLVTTEWIRRRQVHPLEGLRLATASRWAVYGFLVAVIFMMGPTRHTPFVYFQF